MIDAAAHRIRADLACREQREHGPCRLIGCARRSAERARIAVVALTPAAVRVLPALQPLDGLAHSGILAGETCLRETRQHRPCTVNIVGAPAAEPRAVVLLFLAQ